MICSKPFTVGYMEYGCGQCMACRINKSREWTGRMLLESMEHKHSCFITLTIAPEKLNGPNVKKRSLQLFFKKLRLEVGPFRYFAVGEYGDVNWRPHYHVIVFGISPMLEEKIKRCWSYGFVQCGTADVSAMKYVTGYCLKKLTKPSAMLNGRAPEFALMSRRPGLGHGVIERIHSSVSAVNMQKIAVSQKDVRVHGRKYPLGRYLREKIQNRFAVSDVEKDAVRVLTSIEAQERQSVYPSVRAYKVQRAARVSQQNYTRKGRRL